MSDLFWIVYGLVMFALLVGLAVFSELARRRRDRGWNEIHRLHDEQLRTLRELTDQLRAPKGEEK